MTSGSQPMPSSRIGDGVYEVIGTSRGCVVRRVKWFAGPTVWHLEVDGEHVRSFDTKREALVYCQDDITL
jgi:hypothetical protein